MTTATAKMPTSSKPSSGGKGRHRPAGGGGSERVVGMSKAAMIKAVVNTMVVISIGPDVVSRSPAAVPKTIRFVVIRPKAAVVTVAISAIDTACQ